MSTQVDSNCFITVLKEIWFRPNSGHLATTDPMIRTYVNIGTHVVYRNPLTTAKS